MTYDTFLRRNEMARVLWLAGGLALLGGCSDEDPALPVPDSGTRDSGTRDSGTRDSGTRDSGTRDSGSDPCSGVDCSSLDGACTVGVCDPASGACEARPQPDGMACDDGDACTSGDVCAAGSCGGEAVDCSAAGDECNTGMCDPATGECVPVPVADGVPCDDGDVCTTGDMCAGGVCSGEVVDCSASGDMCNAGMCDAATGECSTAPVADGTACAFDLNSCSIDECSAGSCGATRTWCEFASGPLADTPLRGNPTGGMLFEDSCGPDGVIIGVSGHAVPSQWIYGLRFVCGRLELRGDNPFTVDVVPFGETDPLRGTPTGDMFRGECPAGQVVVGFGGRSGSLVDQLVLRCAPLNVALAGEALAVQVGGFTDIAPVPVFATGGSPFPQTDCPTGMVAVEGRGRAGMSVDAFGLGCANPTLSGGVTQLLDGCDMASAVVDRHAGTACRNAPSGASYVDMPADVAAVTLFQDPDCAGPSLRLTAAAALCGLTYDGTDTVVDGNLGSYRLEY